MHVTVVGGGIGGLAAALSLRAAGMEVTVLEQARDLQPVGAGIQVGPNACRVLAELGVLEAMLAAAVAPEAVLVRSHRSGRVLHRTDLGDSVRERFGFPYLHVHRADLVGVLADALPDGVLRLGARVDGLADDEGGCRVTLDDGSALATDIVVGADGIHSRVRETLFGPEEPTFSGYVCWRALVPAERLANWDLPTVCEAYYGPRRSVVSYYVSGGDLYNFVGIVAADADDEWTTEDWTAEGDPADLRHDFADFHAPIRAVAGEVDHALKWAIYDREPLERWTVGRVTLLGDAAHAMLPYLAQGACQAIEDAAVLARCLVRWSAEPATALERYEALRRPHTTRVQKAARRGETTFHLSDWGDVWRRNHALRQAQARGGRGPLDWVYGYDAYTVPLTGDES
jgi:salicylate hydroxylase